MNDSISESGLPVFEVTVLAKLEDPIHYITLINFYMKNRQNVTKSRTLRK